VGNTELNMTSISILKFEVSSPADVTPLEKLKGAGYDPRHILGVVGKSEGEPLGSLIRERSLIYQAMDALTTSLDHSVLTYGNQSSPNRLLLFSQEEQRAFSVHT